MPSMMSSSELIDSSRRERPREFEVSAMVGMHKLSSDLKWLTLSILKQPSPHFHAPRYKLAAAQFRNLSL